MKAHQKLYSYGSGNFTIAFSSNPDVTVTYEGSTTIPAGTEVHVELNRYVPGDVAAGTPGDEQPSITLLTDNSGGTAANTIPAQTGSYVEATQETTVASLAGKINEIIAVLRVANIIATP